jgi:hypothetical protein
VPARTALLLVASIHAVLVLAQAETPASIRVDYPENESVFPPGFSPPPQFLFHDSSNATSWRIAISFGSTASPAVVRWTQGPRMRIGPIDPDCIAETNELPRLTPEQSSARTWRPPPSLWQAIQRSSTAGQALVRITGYRSGRVVSRGEMRFSTSKDPVDAAIFYRDVPLMPSELEKGVIKPLAAQAIPLVAWRIRDLHQPNSRVVLNDVPVCANCHSFSRDGKRLGMDLDGLGRNRGMYFLADVNSQTKVRDQDVIQWSDVKGPLGGAVRVGFMSQVSPTGDYVITTVNPAPGPSPPSNYYVANFKDYRFLQVFFPTRGLLSWYSRSTGILQPLPGADDPGFVQFGAVWTPDGKELIFARAPAQDPDQPGAPPARFANDPQELQIRYDLYRIPFNGGKGGKAEPVAGASGNGMSNTFPKVSPDGRWIVFVHCRNGQLMRPDSELYIVPSHGGQARRMRANTPVMNSWHSFSPNGRWLVFSSKARSPYTQLYLTHIGENGMDTPAVLIENTTAANRAANIPEFVGAGAAGLQHIGGPVFDYYRLVDSATYFERQGDYRRAAELWSEVLTLRPDDIWARRGLEKARLMLGPNHRP